MDSLLLIMFIFSGLEFFWKKYFMKITITDLRNRMSFDSLFMAIWRLAFNLSKCTINKTIHNPRHSLAAIDRNSFHPPAIIAFWWLFKRVLLRLDSLAEFSLNRSLEICTLHCFFPFVNWIRVPWVLIRFGLMEQKHGVWLWFGENTSSRRRRMQTSVKMADSTFEFRINYRKLKNKKQGIIILIMSLPLVFIQLHDGYNRSNYSWASTLKWFQL